jgi:hypothetical protein
MEMGNWEIGKSENSMTLLATEKEGHCLTVLLLVDFYFIEVVKLIFPRSNSSIDFSINTEVINQRLFLSFDDKFTRCIIRSTGFFIYLFTIFPPSDSLSDHDHGLC